MTIGENTRKDIAKTVGSATTVIEAAVDFIVENIDWNLTEHDLSEFIVGRFLMGNKRLAQPRVAFNANSLRSDYASRADAADSIRREGWLLIGVEPVTRQRPEGGGYPIEVVRMAKLGTPASEESQSLLRQLNDMVYSSVVLIEQALKVGDALNLGDIAEFMAGPLKKLGEPTDNAPSWFTLDDGKRYVEAEFKLNGPGLLTLPLGIKADGFGLHTSATLYIDPEATVEIVVAPQTEIVARSTTPAN